MAASDVFGGLRDRAARIFGVIADGRSTLEVHDASQWRALALARFDMLKALDRFVAYKEERILVPIICHGDAESVERARRMKERNHDLRDEYDAFILRWGLTNPLSVSDSYSSEATAMSRRIETAINRDVQALTALVAGAELSAPL